MTPAEILAWLRAHVAPPDIAAADLIESLQAENESLRNRLTAITKQDSDYSLATLATVKDALFCCCEDPDLDHARRVLDAIAIIARSKEERK